MGNDLNFAFDDRNDFVPDQPILVPDSVENDFSEYNPDDEIEDNEEDTSIEVEAEAQNEPVSDVKSPEPTKTPIKGTSKQYSGSYAFIATLEEHLNKKAIEDELFAPFYANPNKCIAECANYVIGWVKEQGKNGFTDPEIFGQAVHYYEESDIKVTKHPDNMQVVVNHAVELTPEEIDQAHQDAIINEQKEHINRIKKPGIAAPKKKVEMPSLF